MNAAEAIEETTRAQREAADPAASVFVSANAGTGKTHVLTARVARLLLNKADPSTILCITFTKAAAAEMADRLFRLLGDWALADDATLSKSLADLVGEDSALQIDLGAARRLFARALETPGGLKIQTIHSFCEGLLKRFPLEAGVAPGFAVIEEREAAALLEAVIDRVAARATGRAAAAFAQLLAKRDGKTLKDLIAKAIAERRRFRRAFDIGWAALGDEISNALGVTTGSQQELSALVNRIAAFDLAKLRELMRASAATMQNYADKVDEFLAAHSPEEKFAALKDVFLTKEGDVRIRLVSASIAKANPEFAAAVDALQIDIVQTLDRIAAADALDDTRALYLILAEVFAAYGAAKNARAALDFDDLIERARILMASGTATQWVLYKLDQGLTHILLDEAQDTSPEAWDVIERPLAEFFAGDGARAGGRTFFAVGDQKQSIYSFQGADAALFKQKESDLGKSIKAAAEYRNILLSASFRSTAPVLRFVDALFARAEVLDNVSSEGVLKHQCTRVGEAGLVELWPLVPRSDSPPLRPWDAPLDVQKQDDANRLLTTEVAATIKDWIKSAEILASAGRPIEAGDILILVQSRKGLFYEAIRALSAAGVPVAGADKLKLLEHQAVLDLLSYARAALFAGDDLSLAEALKSPFFNVDEENLFDLAANRESMSLWRTLVARETEQPDWSRARTDIDAARVIALNEGPVAFFNFILDTGEPSGWKRLAARLGAPAREPVEEFLRLALDFERRSPRSLRLFLDEIVHADADVNREISEAAGAVRVMTVHKAKGLEANIVFLLDAHKGPNQRNDDGLVAIEGPHGDKLPLLTTGGMRKSPLIADAVSRARRLKQEEYRRLLYVAATRARDRLYVCGVESGRTKDPHKREAALKTWHALAEDAFGALPEAKVVGEKFGGAVRRLEIAQTAALKGVRAAPTAPTIAPPADFLCKPARKESRRLRRSPSALADVIELEGRDGPAYSPMRGDDPLLRGTILHRLLELIPDVCPNARQSAATRLAARLGPALGDEALAGLVREALAVIEDARFAPVFAPGSLAEVPIGGRPRGARPDIFLSGKIDRLAVLDDRVLVVDYKTNRPPPTRLEDVPGPYIAQLAAYRGLLEEIYPGRKIEAALLWTFDARLAPIPADALDRAFLVTLA
jgi:ATP-dependent helicase/nuclease subunit A